MLATVRAAEKLGVAVVAGCTGSPIWPLATDADYVAKGLRDFARLWTPILDACRDAGIKFAMDTLKSVPKDNREALEAHITGVLIVFWAALWGSFGTEYARDFIEAQLRGMEPDLPHEVYTPPRVQ